MTLQMHFSENAMQITLTLAGSSVSRFFPILGEGIFVMGPEGESVEGFLQKAAGVSPDYLKNRVQTVFLDGRVLDDVGTALVGEGATVALSAAMPGLAGAVLRRGGFYAAMRRPISHETSARTQTGRQISATLKLFNLVARDLGPELLTRGIRVPGDRLQDFIARQGRWLWHGCVAAELNGQLIEAGQIADLIQADRQVVLIVKAA
jgi:hypothetical protein